jgi:type IX secretion system substrate protein/ASPM-SPD-2-Hydin domain-containing protein
MDYVVPLMWEGDQHNSPNYAQRRNLYGVGGLPHAQFGGIYDVVGGGTNMYPYYVTRYNWLIEEDSPMEIDMKVHMDDSGDYIFSADVEMTGDISTTNNKIIFIITKYWNDNYFCTVSTYEQLDFELTETGETGSFETTLDLDDSWDLDDLKAVVIVQTLSGDHKIHQANISSIQSIMQILSPMSFDFGEVPVGQSVTEQIYITNYWDEDLSGAIFPIPGFDIISNFSVPPNQTQAFDITFTPEEEIYYDSFIIMMSNNEYFQTQLVTVTGTGTDGTDTEDDMSEVPELSLRNYPNPFNPETTINFSLTGVSSANTKLAIYNLEGQQIIELINGQLDSGEYSVKWNGKDDNDQPVPSGMYFYKLNTGQTNRTKKMILLK